MPRPHRSRSALRSPPKLGRHLEWHGNRIRVVVRVPPSLTKTVGKTKLKAALNTRDPLEAEREKVDVIKRLRAELRGEAVSVVAKPLNEEALTWRDALRADAALSADEGEGGDAAYALEARLDQVRAEHGPEAALTFAAVASGTATPLDARLARWFAEKKFSIGYVADIRRTVEKLAQWCRETSTPATVEAISREVAGSFIHDRYVEPQVDPKTANKDISCLHSYWRWMRKRVGVDNPWSEQRIAEDRAEQREATEATGDKRPFTDDEAAKLLAGIRLRREREFSLVAALSGLRVNEIAGLRIKDCRDGKIAVTKSKTKSGLRTVPAHPALVGLIAKRSEGKALGDYLFDELPEQQPGSKRDRSAPVSQAFTRERRRLGVDERASEKQRQSNVDFHSWRRWFVRKAVEALEKGAKGYSPWTIAHVIGHKVEDGTIEGQPLPLGMTMGVYAGAASWDAMLACVEAVQKPPQQNLPPNANDHRRQPAKRRHKIPRVARH